MWTARPLLAMLAAICAAFLPVASPSQAGDMKVGTYVLAYRTAAHVSRSGPEVFQEVVNNVLEFLRSNQVRVVADPLRGTILTDDEFPLETMLNLKRESGATHLLYVVVDRPVAAWVKVTLRCYSETGPWLWEETAQDKGSMTGKGGLKKTLERMRKKLQPRLGQACLVREEVEP